MTINGPFGRSTSATERLDAARAAKQEAISRELCWASIGSRIWPSFLMPNATKQQNYSWLLVLETPRGRLVYRLADDELTAFDHLERKRENDGKPHADKLATLLWLATEGWPT